jgi:hypothetical protein
MMKTKLIDEKLKEDDPISEESKNGVIHSLKFGKNFHHKCCQV